MFGASDATTVRVGYGLYYTAIEGLSAGIMSANPPYGMDFDSFGPPLFETPFVVAATGQNTGQRFPSPIANPGASARNPDRTVDWSAYLPIAHMPGYDSRNVTPYTESYTLSVERQLRSTTLKVSYLGAQAHHLLVLASANPGNPSLCLSLSRPEDVMPGSAICGPFGENNTYYARDGRVIQGTRGPFGPESPASPNRRPSAIRITTRSRCRCDTAASAAICLPATHSENRSISRRACPKQSTLLTGP